MKRINSTATTTIVSSAEPIVRRIARTRARACDVPDVVQDSICAILERAQVMSPHSWEMYAVRVTLNVCARYHSNRYRRREVDWSLSESRQHSDEALEREPRPSVDLREWIGVDLLPALPKSLARTPAASRRRWRLVSLMGATDRARRSIKGLARELGCQPAQVRGDIEALAELVRRKLPELTPPNTL